MSTIHRTVSVGSLSSISSEGSLTGKKKKINNNSVTVGFKNNWFQNTLSFVKDDRRLSLNYGVTPAQAAFVRHTLNFEAGHFGTSPKLEKYAPLYEALLIFGLKYNFKLSRVSKDVLVLQKIPKNSKQTVKPDSTTKPCKLSPKIEREKTVVDRLSQNYMVEIAETILDFMEDPTRASLEFTRVKPLESMFMQCVMNASRPLFPQHAQMLKYMKEIKPKLDYSLQVVIGKVDKNTNMRTVTFKKEPKFSKKGRRSRDSSLNRSNISLKAFLPSSKDTPNSTQTQQIDNSVQNGKDSMQVDQNLPNNIQIIVQNVTQRNSTQTARNSTSLERNSTQSEPNSMQVEQNSTQNERNSTSVEQNSAQRESISMQVEQISVQMPMDVDTPRSIGSEKSKALGSESSSSVVEKSLGSVHSSQTSLSQNSSSTRNNTEKGRRLDPRRTKLLEAMSMPVQLDKPARMMQMMGWDGGPLGCRGVGITEPIIPTLDLVAGAGLGHVKEPKVNKPSVHVQLEKQARLMQKSGKDARPPGITEPIIPALDLVSLAGFGHVNEPKAVKPCKPKEESNFRLDLLRAILDLILTDKQKIVLERNKLKKKQIRFVRQLVTSLNNRKIVALHDVAESSAVKLVAEAMKKMPYVVVNGTVCQDKVKITLTKGAREGERFTIEEQTTFELPPPQTRVITKEHLHKLAETINVYKDLPSKAKRYIGIRITVLIEILHLLKSDMRHKELIFDSPLCVQHVNYIVKAVEKINRGKIPDNCPKILERDTCNEILRYIKGTVLAVNIQNMGVIFEKLLPHQTNDYNSTVVSTFRSFDIININNNNEPVPYSNHEKVKYHEKRDFSINDGMYNRNIGNYGSINSLSTGLNSKNNVTPARNDDLNGRSSRDAKGVNSTITKDIVNNGKTNVGNDSDVKNGECSDATRNCNGKSALTKDNESDDDVILIEKKYDTVVISDDESTKTDEITENIDTDNKSSSTIEEKGLELKITNVEYVDQNISQGSADMDISRSQNSAEECQERVDLLESQESTELETSKSLNSIEFDALSSGGLSSDQAQCEESIDTVRSEEPIDKARSKEFIDIESSKGCLDVGRSEGSIDVGRIEGSVDEGRCEAAIDIAKNKESIAVTLSGKQYAAISETDINKDTKTMPEKEKLSYSKEYDRDLHDLDVVLNLDDEIFDYTAVKKEDSDTTEKPMSKRSRSDSEQSSPDNPKKTKFLTFNKFKNVLIVPRDYPGVELKKECTIKIQTILSDAIDNCKELPLLKCHGIQDGGLIYSCHDEQSLFFIQNSLSVTSNYKIINDVIIKKTSHKMKIKFNSLLDDTKKLFNRLELYNAGLITDSWKVKYTQKFEDYMLMSIELDDYSYKYICDNNFCLYGGIDAVRFTIEWD